MRTASQQTPGNWGISVAVLKGKLGGTSQHPLYFIRSELPSAGYMRGKLGCRECNWIMFPEQTNIYIFYFIWHAK